MRLLLFALGFATGVVCLIQLARLGRVAHPSPFVSPRHSQADITAPPRGTRR